LKDLDVKGLKGIGKGLIEFIGVCWLIVFFGELFRAYTLAFVLLWLSIPVVVTIAHYAGVSKKISKKNALYLRNATMAVVVSLSIMFFFGIDNIHDQVGATIVGYSSSYVEDTDENGRPIAIQQYTTSTSSGKHIIWAVDGFIMFFAIVLPILDWKQSNAIFESIHDN